MKPSGLSLLAATLVFVGQPLAAQVKRIPGDARTTTIAPRQLDAKTTVTVRVLWKELPNSTPTPLGRATICVGDSTNPRRYGTVQMLNPAGEKSISGVPRGAPVLVSVFHENGHVTMGARSARRLTGTNERFEFTLNGWENGPTCSTPLRSKPLPTRPTPPYLAGRLRTSPAGLVRTRDIELFTTSQSMGNRLEVQAEPTAFRTSQSRDFGGAQWRPTTGSYGTIPAIPHTIQGADGRKRIYLQLRNATGISDTYEVEIDFVDLYRCELTYARAPNATESRTMDTEELSLMRAQSRTLDVAWPSANEGKPGYGMHLRWARNTGDHPIEITVGGGLIWNRIVLEPRQYRAIRADLKSVRCP